MPLWWCLICSWWFCNLLWLRPAGLYERCKLALELKRLKTPGLGGTALFRERHTYLLISSESSRDNPLIACSTPLTISLTGMKFGAGAKFKPLESTETVALFNYLPRRFTTIRSLSRGGTVVQESEDNLTNMLTCMFVIFRPWKWVCAATDLIIQSQSHERKTEDNSKCKTRRRLDILSSLCNG